MSISDWNLDRVIHVARPDTLTVDYNIERATTDLRSDRLMRQLESCRHLQSPFCMASNMICVAERSRVRRSVETASGESMLTVMTRCCG